MKTNQYCRLVVLSLLAPCAVGTAGADPAGTLIDVHNAGGGGTNCGMARDDLPAGGVGIRRADGASSQKKKSREATIMVGIHAALICVPRMSLD